MSKNITFRVARRILCEASHFYGQLCLNQHNLPIAGNSSVWISAIDSFVLFGGFAKLHLRKSCQIWLSLLLITTFQFLVCELFLWACFVTINSYSETKVDCWLSRAFLTTKQDGRASFELTSGVQIYSCTNEKETCSLSCKLHFPLSFSCVENVLFSSILILS